MQKILIVSDNEFINLLYVMNLEVYLACDAILVSSIAAALCELTLKNKINLVVTLDAIKKEPAVDALITHMKASGIKAPIVVVGAEKENSLRENVFSVTGKFNIQSVLKVCAKVLGITAKHMAELNIGAYYPVSIAPLRIMDVAPCAIYEKEGETYVRIVQPDDEIADVLKASASKGLEHLYVSSADRLKIINRISLTLIEKMTTTLKSLDTAPVEKKVQALSDGYEFAAANLFSTDEIKQQMQEIATASANVMSDVAREIPNLKSLLATMLANRDGYIFTHSMITSYVCYHMIKNVTWGGESQVDKINFVLFFHDIFLAPIYLKYPELKSEVDLLENEKLSEKEKDIVLNHAKLAAEMVVTYKRCPMGADILIKQHHGMKKGKGFVKFYMEDLSPLSKVILIAELFVEEFMKTAGDQSKPFNSKAVIPKLISEFRTPSYTKIVQSLVNVPL
jgi:response regulator RpfG family c-di-GMP phosphodiesterase